ncbi:NAD(P)/FAD-dependent oxidoreductase [Thalassolituus sp. ST750PaO-4]|uniref:NAD(P)/FAD-dependent oxidoreductase n=1 Tax=Thalassolituus sp. ST750PaO-4 TaxID=2742965 RepID=UPI001CE27165|nr:FAD-dependent oxidoreductase [Thalassolituus sp. ST750PaO-4]MCA6059898.1 NAD(P)/FAD-dependent oxidoreductase [Thalassolituus sp. ST750PaO-4]
MATNILVIIGNGLAANRVLEQLGEIHPFSAIHVLSDEPVAHYNRIMLSPLLAGETTLNAITPHDQEWYQSRRISVYLKQNVERIDTLTQQVICSGGDHFAYDALILATGSRSFVPDIPGADATNVVGFRSLRDVDTMFERLPDIQHATVIGAGLLGVEAATGLRSHGIQVTLLHRNPVLMNRQMDATASALLEKELLNRGIDVRTGCTPLKLCSSNAPKLHINTIQFEQAERHIQQQLDTDLVVFATGIIANKELAESAGIHCAQGIQVDALMRTSHPHIYALGECCEFNGNTYGLVAPIWEQASILARQLHQQYQTDQQQRLSTADPLLSYQEREHLTKLKVSGVDIHSIGQFEADSSTEVLQLLDEHAGIYKKILLRDERIVGALCVGDVADSHWYYELMQQGDSVTALRPTLLFGQAYC